MSQTLSTPSAPTGYQFRPAELITLVGVKTDTQKSRLSTLRADLCRRGCLYLHKRIALGQMVVAVIQDGAIHFADPHEANGEAIESREEVAKAFKALI